ncbi:hypothetical protein RhiXN_10727 [Rhizoctonia solani]|uniref:DUF6532 domain-containing protein n=1 Tax=Rhizoctonia solani TaxID=456999 RepID=A0A8H8P4S8_9AGAM|nr:uncharacterized protein RhiXN_10727 [Rhizoctonia solani]QRW25651.1 hypothetical protein RhiXN_10727 [Rhizoctonia solani]
MLGGREEPPRQNSQPIPSNAAQHNQQQHVSLNSTRSGPSSSGALLCSKSKRSSAKQKRSKRGASGNQHVGGGNGHTSQQLQGNEAPAQDKDEGGMEGDEDKPIDTHKSGSRGRLKDFHGPEKHVLQWAGRLFIAIMASRGIVDSKLGPLHAKESKLTPMTIQLLRLTWKILTTACAPGVVILEITWWITSNIFFNAQMSRAEVKEEVEQLKTGALHMKPNLEPGTGYFQHLLLQIFLNENLFKFKKDIGPQFPQYFKKIQFLVEEWDTGVRVRSNLDFETQQKAYNTHLESHAVFLGELPGRWALIQDQLFARAFKHSSASKLAIPLDNKNVLRRKDATMDNTQQIGVNQGFKQDGEDWAEQDRLLSHGGSANNTPKRQNSHYNHDNRGYKPEHSRSHQQSNDRDHVQPGALGNPERSFRAQPALSGQQPRVPPKPRPTSGPDSYSQRGSYSQGFGNNGNRQHPQDWNDQSGHAEFSQTTIIVITNLTTAMSVRAKAVGTIACRLARSVLITTTMTPICSRTIVMDARTGMPCRVDHSLSGGACNTHNQRKYPQGGSFNDGGITSTRVHLRAAPSQQPPSITSKQLLAGFN